MQSAGAVLPSAPAQLRIHARACRISHARGDGPVTRTGMALTQNGITLHASFAKTMCVIDSARI
jgi:hypothetical protein